MWVEKTKEGTYKYRERFTDPVTGKSKTLSITLSKNNASSKKEALIALQEKYKSLLEFKKDITLIELRTLYLEWQKRQVKASTYRRNEGSTNSIMKILGKDTLANILSAGYVKKAFVNSGKSNTTLNEYLKRFKAWMNWAYKNDYIEDVSFLDKIDYLKDTTRKDKLTSKFLEQDEANAIINQLRRKGLYNHYYFAKFMLLTGLRIGEVIALEKKDIDRKAGCIHIYKTYDMNNDLVTTTKTASSTRDIPLTEDLMDLISQINSYYRQQKIISINGSLLFKRTNGQHYCSAAFNKCLKNAAKSLGFDKEITSHALRHTYASLLMEKGVPIDTISRLLGHENSKITKDIYLHVTEKLKMKDFELIRQIKVL